MAAREIDGSAPGACRVELFGVARLLAGVKQVEVELDEGATVRGVLRGLARRCPGLVGAVIRPDLTGLVEGHVLNLNGLSFVADAGAPVAPGDALLLLSSSAGG